MSKDEERPPISIGIPVALGILGVSASAYVLGFYFERGYFDAFGLPPELIDVQTNTLLLFAAISIGAVAATWPILSLSVMLPMNTLHPVLARTVVPILLTVATFLALFATRILDPGWWPWFAGVIGVISFLQLVFPLLTQRGTQGYINKLKAQETTETQVKSISDFFGVRLSRQLGLAISTFLIGTSLAWVAGQAEARNKTTYLALELDPNMLVIRAYPDHMLLTEFEPQTKALGEKFEILPVPPQGLHLVRRVFTTSPFDSLFIRPPSFPPTPTMTRPMQSTSQPSKAVPIATASP